jgi:hypothetical protein
MFENGIGLTSSGLAVPLVVVVVVVIIINQSATSSALKTRR